MTNNQDRKIILNCHCEPKGRACTPKCVTARRREQSDEVVARAKPVAISRVPSLRSGQGFVAIAPRNDLIEGRGIG